MFTLKANESLAVKNLPKDATYTIVEVGDGQNAYETSMTVTKNNGNSEVFTPSTEPTRVSGTIEGSTNILVTYTNTFHYTLPETGGPGTTWYTYGVLPALVAAVVLYKRSRKKGGDFILQSLPSCIDFCPLKQCSLHCF